MKVKTARYGLKGRVFNHNSLNRGLGYRLLPCTLLLLFILSLIPTGALANMASPVRPGSALGEPSGDLKSIKIERETLTIDLRPLGQSSPAIIEAIYRVRNEGDPRAVDLIFVANALTQDGGGVWLDDQSIPSKSADAESLPSSWQPPQTTPAIDGGTPIRYEVKREGAITFTLQLAPGAHTIRVRYSAQATAYASQRSPNIYWQLGYVLSPAKQWAGFGGLDAKVLLPAGWNAESSPSMKRDGDTLVGTWNELPADALGLTLQSPPLSETPYKILRGVIFIGGLMLCLAFGWLMGRWFGKRQRTSAWALPLSLLTAFVWGLSFFLTYGASVDASKGRDGSQASWVYGYGEVFIMFVFFLLMVPFGLILTQLSAFLGARRAAE